MDQVLPIKSSFLKIKASSFSRAFSLIEIVLALFIVTFSFLSLLELISLGLSTNRDSQEETTIALIAQSLLAEPLTLSESALSRYYSTEGMETTSKESLFCCDIRFYKTLSPFDPQIQMSYVDLTFSWPSDIPLKNRKSKLIHASLYQP